MVGKNSDIPFRKLPKVEESSLGSFSLEECGRIRNSKRTENMFFAIHCGRGSD